MRTYTAEEAAFLAKADRFAAMAHTGQVRKYTGDPYIVHPRAVAAKVAERGGTVDMIAAALLHDVLEDTPIDYDTLKEGFGQEVAYLVWELTDEYTTEAFPQLNRAVRKAMEATRLSKVSDAAKEIKLCDLMDNTSTIVEHDPHGFAPVYLREKAALLEKMFKKS